MCWSVDIKIMYSVIPKVFPLRNNFHCIMNQNGLLMDHNRGSLFTSLLSWIDFLGARNSNGNKNNGRMELPVCETVRVDMILEKIFT